jgi:PAS domain S-box-containing protein
LEELVGRLPLALVAWDKEFKIKTWNPAAAKIFGFSEPEFLEKSVVDLFSQKQGAPTVNRIWDRLQKGESANFVGQNATKDGKSIVCSWTNTPLKDPNGNLHDVLSMVQDVTEKKRLEERLKEITYALSGIKAGESYLASSLQHCLKIAFDLHSHGVKCLCIVREDPDSLIKDYYFKAEDIVLLSIRPVKDFKAINDLQEIAVTVTKFLENGGGVIILGGLEYLVSRNGFNPVFMMIQEKRFEVLEAEATLLVPVSMETLDTREKGLLNSELKLTG